MRTSRRRPTPLVTAALVRPIMDLGLLARPLPLTEAGLGPGIGMMTTTAEEMTGTETITTASAQTETESVSAEIVANGPIPPMPMSARNIVTAAEKDVSAPLVPVALMPPMGPTEPTMTVMISSTATPAAAGDTGGSTPPLP